MKNYLNIMLVINKGMDCVAGASLVLIMLLTSLDVALRYLGYPIQGSYDMVSMGGVLVIGFALPKTSWDRMHIHVDILTVKLPGQKKVLFELTTRVIAIALFILIGWNLSKLGASFFKTGEGTLTLGIPLYPVAYALGVSAFVECLVLLADMVRVCYEGGQHE
jgi:TRAP-type C4-dicarboxylate transport system permease small subunit